MKRAIHDFTESRSGPHARDFFGSWRGTLLACDDDACYKALFEQGVTEAGCMAHVRHHLRRSRARPLLEALHAWLTAQRGQVPNGSATAKATGYAPKRWGPLTRYLEDAQVPIDNNWLEKRIRPVALGRRNWLFAGSLRAGQRAAAIEGIQAQATVHAGAQPIQPQAQIHRHHRDENPRLARTQHGISSYTRTRRVNSASSKSSRITIVRPEFRLSSRPPPTPVMVGCSSTAGTKPGRVCRLGSPDFSSNLKAA